MHSRNACILHAWTAALIACTGPQGPKGDPGSAGFNGSSANGAESNTVFDAGEAGVYDTKDLPPPVPGKRLVPKSITTLTTITTSDGAKRVTASTEEVLFDKERDEFCAYQVAADGQTRCLPSKSAFTAPALGPYFADSACTRELLVRFVGTNPCRTAAEEAPVSFKYALRDETTNGCSGKKVFTLGPKVATPTIFAKSGTSCISSAANGQLEYYEKGPEAPPSSFVQVSISQITQGL